MREIQFRAWHKKESKMCEIGTIRVGIGAFLIGVLPAKDEVLPDLRAVVVSPKEGRFCNKEEFELMQYTGLNDKNGKERYFDDIVKITWRKDTDSYLQQGDDYIEKEFIARIVWHIDRIVYVLANRKKLNCPSDVQVEVIGNIYENPELLK